MGSLNLDVLAPIIAGLIKDAIDRHKAGLPQKTQAEIADEIQTLWDQDVRDAQELRNLGHEGEVTSEPELGIVVPDPE